MTIHDTQVGAPGPVDRATVSGTLTPLYPLPTDKVYTDCVIEIVVEFTAAGNVPSDAYAEIAVDASTGCQVVGNPVRLFVPAGTPNKATATFYVFIPPAAPLLQYVVTSANETIVYFDPYKFPGLSPDPTKLTITYFDKDPLYLDTPGYAAPPFSLPISTPNTFTYYFCTVRDPSTNPPAPVQNYLVEWQQAWDNGLFDPDKVVVYGGTSPILPALKADYINYDLKKDGVVRTKTTGSNGQANLYIASRNAGTYFSVKCAARYTDAKAMNPVTIVGPEMIDQKQPYLNLLNDDLDSVEGDYVNVGVSTPSGVTNGDSLTYLLFLNKNLIAVQVINIPDEGPIPPYHNIPVGKVSFNSTGDGSNGLNQLQYAVSSQIIGELTSLPLNVILSGNKGQNIPPSRDDRYLTAPWINGAGQMVTRSTIQDGVDCRFSTVPNPAHWPNPKAGDVVSLALLANGWDTRNGEPKTPLNLPVTMTLTAADLSNGYAQRILPKYPLLGFGPKGADMATLYFSGYVQVQGTGPKIYTKINQYMLST